MKPMIKYQIQETPIQVVHDNGEVVIKNGILLEGDQLCAIYDTDEASFSFVCTMIDDLTRMLSTQSLSIRADEKMLYVCNECHEMHADETYICQACNCESLRLVSESELIN